ncbi:MAG: portal protein [Pseudomonadales bacterium]
MSEKRATQIIDQLRKKKTDREGSWESHWEEIAERVLTRQSKIFFNSNPSFTKGEKKTEKQFDASPEIALGRFASVMETMISPTHQMWHNLRASDESLNRKHAVRVYLEQINKILWRQRYRSTANYQSQQYETYMSLGAYGTGALWIDAADGGGLRYRSMHLSEVYFDINHQGVVDTIYRRYEQTARQLMQEFDEPSKQIREAADKDPDKKFWIIHCVRPNGEMDSKRVDFRGMEFSSIYVDEDNKFILSEGGFATFPMALSRYITTPGEIYGRSPAMLALPAIKSLNEMKKSVLTQGHRINNPALFVHDDGIMDGLNIAPNAVNYGGVSKDGRMMVHTLPTGNLAAGQEMMQMEKDIINDAFLVNIFQVLIDRRGQTPPTATEVLELTKEKGSLLAPTMGRQQSEAQGPMIERELDLLAKQGIIPPMPPELIEAAGEFEIEYDSPLARAQKAEQASGMFRSLELATTHANVTQDPAAFDWFNMDVIMPQVMDINNVPASWQSSQKQVDAKREGRNQQAETQQLIEAAPAAAGIIKAVQ